MFMKNWSSELQPLAWTVLKNVSALLVIKDRPVRFVDP